MIEGANAVVVGRLERERAVATADRREVNFVMVVVRVTMQEFRMCLDTCQVIFNSSFFI